MTSTWPQKVVAITMDIDEPVSRIPATGEYLASIGKRGIGSVYQILAVREVRRRFATGKARFAMTCRRATVLDAIDKDVWEMFWYPRNRKVA